MLFVAEIGSMHKGSPSLARELIRQAAHAGADIAKFQLGWPPDDPLRHIDGWSQTLAKWCADYNIEFMASLWAQEGLRAAERANMCRYKVAAQKSGESAFLEMVLSTGKEVFVSVDPLMSRHQPALYGNAKYIWCVSKYPAYPENLENMPERFGGDWYGYSDHSHGIGACLLAIARGSMYTEKHLTLDKTDLTVRDTPFSATPDEFADLVKYGKEIAMFR